MTELKGSRASSFIRRPDTAMKAVLFYGPDEGLVRERAQDTVKALDRKSVV